MPRTITVKGIGKVSAAPDFVVLSMGLECLAAPMMAKCAEIDMEPDDIDVSDTATFVWEIK